MDGLLIAALLLATGSALWLLLQPAMPRLAQRFGSWRVHNLLKRSLPASHYSVFHNVVLPAGPDGSPAPRCIDHVVVSPYAIFVIESRHLAGWISGSAGDAEWTRTRFLAKLTFPNPLRQAHSHSAALRDFLGLEGAGLHTLVVFTGDARFCSAMPANVTQLGGLMAFVQVRTREQLGFDEAKRVADLLKTSRPSPGAETAAAHLTTLRQTHGSRFSARQAVLGLGLMCALLGAAGSLVQRLAETPGRYPSREGPAALGPFADDSSLPRIELPGTTHEQVRPFADSASVTPQAAPRASATAANSGDAVRAEARRRQEVLDQRLAWEASLRCAYSIETRRCACYEPQGRKAEMDYDSCRMLADRGPATPRD